MNSNLKQLFIYCKPYKRLYSLILCLNICIGILELTVPYILIKLIHTVSGDAAAGDKGSTFSRILFYSIFYLLISCMGFISRYKNQQCKNKFGLKICQTMRSDVYETVLGKGLDKAKDKRAGDVVTTLTQNIHTVERFLQTDFHEFTYQGFRFLGAVIFIGIMNWKLLLVSLTILPLSVWLTRITMRSISEISQSLADKNAVLTSSLIESYNGIKTIKSYLLNPLLVRSFAEETRCVKVEELKLEKRLSLLIPVNIFLNAFPYAACVLYGGYLTLQHQLDIGELLAMVSLMNLIVRPISTMPDIVAHLKKCEGILARVFELIPPAGQQFIAVTDETAQQDSLISMEIKGLSFNLEGQTILKDVSLSIDRPQLIALTGKSGSGKTTLVKLICGFYQFPEGTIEIFGQDNRSIPQNMLMQNISYVSQESFIFTTSLYENIRYGQLDASREEVLHAAKIAQVDQFAVKLPNQYETMVSNQTLSGGQRQRVAIARAFLKKAKILILDEPTSALDTVTEQKIIEALESLKREKIIILISHQVSTLLAADMILYLEHGNLHPLESYKELQQKDLHSLTHEKKEEVKRNATFI
ncbi:hypothetical protein DCC85_07590 [Paenibacillus sp. CAA11]|uniref:ABC transporter ATP-binding protein n=1 Tax=Paenibacillus sp. CAA11 TaxID=1532905 RepID=UPI000D3B3AF3|nr:ABC transporter ATP-binding protein [Paenibacillus sp. CAA11]AWB44093.1 hypothetical protein DCC85_07590 [Paenibacillus sp. CAA11]